MFRTLSIVVLGVVSTVSTPAEGQLLRRFARQPNQNARQNQQLQTRNNAPNRSAQTKQANGSSQQNQNYRNGAKSTAPVARPNARRFAVFFNRLTNQTIYRPIQPTTKPSTDPVRKSVVPRPTAQPQLAPRTSVSPTTQVDVARQIQALKRPTASQPATNSTRTNPRPLTSASLKPEVAQAKIPSPAAGTLTSQPKPTARSVTSGNKVPRAQQATAARKPEKSSEKTFSVLEFKK